VRSQGILPWTWSRANLGQSTGLEALPTHLPRIHND
jgi:hypothetical protein